MMFFIRPFIPRCFIPLICFAVFFWMGRLCPLSEAAEGISLPRKTIGVLSDAQTNAQNDLTQRFQKALKSLAEEEFRIVFPKTPACCAHWAPKKAHHAFQTAIKDPEIDLIFVNGALFAAKAVQLAGRHAKPMVGLFQWDPAFVLPKTTIKIPSLALTVIPGQVEADLKTMSEMFKAEALTILVDEAVLEGVKGLRKRLIKAGRAAGFRPQIKPVQKTAMKTVEAVNTSAQKAGSSMGAVYLTPGGQMPGSERKILIQKLNDQGAYVFSGVGEADIQNGALAVQRAPSPERLARHAALNAMHLLSGRPIKASINPLTPGQKLMINEDTAAAVGYHVSPKVAEEAREVEPVPEHKSVTAALPEVERLPFEQHLKKAGVPKLTLAQAVQRALENNARLSIKQAEVEEDRQDRDRVLTELFPQIKGQVEYRRVDENAAKRSFETTALERSTGGVLLRQLIFSDPVISRLRAANRSVDSAQFKEASQRLDVAARTQKRYIDCLAAAAVYWIREYNLNLTRQNLKTAKDRQAAGTGGPQEVYRWEAQEAQDRSQVLTAQSALERAMVGLNRIMGEDQQQIWAFEDCRDTRMEGIFDPRTFQSLIRNPGEFLTLNRFVIHKALDTSPELKSVDNLIDANRILRGYHQRRFYTPEASMEFGYRHTFDRTYDNPASFQDMSTGIPGDADNHWQLQLKLEWPLFEGGGKIVDVRKNRATLRRLESVHRQAREIIEERARNALIQASTARSDVDLSRTAAEAAKKNFKVVQNGYAQGVSTILDLLDAQREAVVQERKAIMAEYRFVKAVVEVERSMNQIAALVPVETQKARWRELKARLGQKEE
ncbi:MAG: TolC family protein [Deltaproteobacteria bacterium]|nr:TolC family protein [Deltaproteobacteria bacterium]